MHARGAIKAPYHIWVAIALTWIAGFVDIVGYVVLYRVFVANMTGNTIALGRGLVEGDWGLFLSPYTPAGCTPRGFARTRFSHRGLSSRYVWQMCRHATP